MVFLALQREAFNADNWIYLLAAICGAAIGVALLSVIFVEGLAYMVLFVPARIKKLKDQGREEGQQELQQQWLDWNERRLAAEREGQPFTEPPPTGPQRSNGK